MLLASTRRLHTFLRHMNKTTAAAARPPPAAARAFTSSSSSFSSSSSAPLEPTVLVSSSGSATVLTLNRPKKLNALTLQMVRELTAGFRASSASSASSSPASAVNIMVGAGGRAFCAGGDVAAVRAAGLGLGGADASLTRDFFYEEYRLNHLIGETNETTPQVSVWDGITMGGGVGVSVHGRFRVCTEKVLFAKPETGIGLFPDVGASHFLGAMPGATGEYIALTGARLKHEDLIYAGIATHFVSSDLVDELCAALGEIPADTPAGEARADAVERILEVFVARSPALDVAANSTLARHRGVIDACFAATDVEGIVAALRGVAEDGGDGEAEFARQTVETLGSMSPTSLKITLEQVRRGAALGSLGECLQMEFRMCQRLMQDTNSDFYEGIRAVLVDRDGAPKWDPAALGDVTPAKVQSYFERLPEEEELRFD